MATGIIGVLAGSGSLSYAPASNAKVNLIIGGSAGVQMNGIPLAVGSYSVYVGGGQTLTLFGATGSNIIASSVEES